VVGAIGGKRRYAKDKRKRNDQRERERELISMGIDA
jgi:hypothetical protein